MSADNWAICPRCKAKKDSEAETRVKAAQDAYGKVSAEEYTQLLDAAKAPVAYGNSLREDYEIGVFEDGIFTVSYSGGCRDCGWSHEFRHEEQIESTDKDLAQVFGHMLRQMHNAAMNAEMEE